jgi:mono/diheme cytochrome c family protein
MKHPNSRQSLVRTLSVVAVLGALLPLSATAGPDAASLKRGAYLVSYGGCVDCHTPFKMGPNGPEKDMARGLSGHPENLLLSPPPKLEGEDWNWTGASSMTAFKGPWGLSYASNLTPDRETGIGNWTAKDFVRAMKSGQHVGPARPIMPPMPWQSLATLTERDLQAIYVYLMAQPAVKNRVVEYQPPVAGR